MVADGVLISVTQSDWAKPLVVVPKPDDKVRLCGGYKVKVNSCAKTGHYLLPTVEDIFTVLAGGKVFTVLYISTGYR